MNQQRIALYSLFFLLFSTFLHAETVIQFNNQKLNPETEIKVIFENAVVTEDSLNAVTENKILLSKPKIKGDLIWKSTNLAIFKPTEPITMGEEYTFSIKSGQKYRDGSKIPGGKLQMILSEPFELKQRRLISKRISHTRQPDYYASFNDAVDPQKVVSHFIFMNKAGKKMATEARQAVWGDIKSSYYRGTTWSDRVQKALTGKDTTYSEELTAEIPNAVIISPIAPLPIGDDWQLHVLKSIPNASKTAKTLHESSLRVGHIKPFTIEKTVPHIKANKPRQIHIRFNYPLDPLLEKQLPALINISPKLANAKYQISGNSIVIDGDLRQFEEWKVSVGTDVQAMNGLVTGKTLTTSIEFQALPTGLALPSFDSAQFANGNRHYSVDTVNLQSLHIKVKKLNSEQAVRAMQGYQHYKGRGHNQKTLKPKHPLPYSLIIGETIYDQTVQLDNAIDTSKELPIDWKTIDPSGDETATYFISITGKAKEDAEGDDRIAQAFLQLTDIGLCWKLNDDEAVVYAFSNQTGKPLADVSFDVFLEDSQVLSSSKKLVTNNNGIVRVPRNKQARHLRASSGNDSYIIPFDGRLDTVRLWQFPVSVEWNHIAGWKRSALLFTDRNLYRPGETVHLKGIVRQFLDNQIKRSDDKTAQLMISDSASHVIVDKEITLSENGTFDHSLTLPSETVGNFRIQLIFPENETQEEVNQWKANQYRIFSHNINVQEFRRNAYEVTTNIAETKPGDEEVSLTIQADYYQGQAVQGGRANWSCNVNQTGFYPEKFRDFLFGDHRSYDYYYWDHYFGYSGDSSRRESSYEKGTVQLDNDGKQQLEIKLKSLEFPHPRKISIHTEVTDSRNQTLTSTASQMLHPADTYIGISRIDQLIRVGKAPDLQVIAVDTEGNQLTEAVEITATITREYNESVKVQSPDGKTSVQNTKKTADVSNAQLTIEAGKSLSLPFIPEHAGRHIITLSGTDKNGHAFSTASYLYIYGAKEYPWAVEDGMKIKLIPEQKHYKPGDTARILVMTPIEGTALVTLERSNVQREFLVDLRADNPVIEIPVSEEDSPNVYVSVVVIRGSDDSPRKHKAPALKLGYCTLNVTNTHDRLDIDLEVEGSKHRPSEPTTISGLVTHANGSPAINAEVVLYAEDEGTLAVAGYKNPDPMQRFHAPRPLLINCGTSFSTFISEDPNQRYYGNKGFTIGGGSTTSFFGSDASSAQRILSRTNFDPCAVWLPTTTTDNNGKFTATFDNPDTLTRYRVIAIALQGDTKFGSATTEYTVDKPLMIEPTAPRYASEGDQLKPKVLVQNKSEYSGKWAVSLQTSDQSEIMEGSQTKKTIELKPGASTTVYFDVKFTSTGTAKWIWTAQPLEINGSSTVSDSLYRELSDKAETNLEVTYPVPLMRQVEFVSLKSNNSQNLLTSLKSELLQGRGHIDLTCSNSLLLEATGAVDYLLTYPYGCLEQTTSSLMPWFAVSDLKTLVPKFSDKSDEDIAKAIQSGVDRIMSMQTSSGGLAYWSGGTSPEYWASSYGGLGLLLAKKHGADVSDQAIENLTTWLSKRLKANTDDLSKDKHQWNAEAYTRSLYVLALAGKAEIALQNKLLDQQEKLNPTAQAFLALAIHTSGDQQTAITLLNKKVSRSQQKHWMLYNADDAMSVLAWSEISPESNQVDQAMHKMLADRNPYGHWRTTWCNSWALQAMASYARNVETSRQPSTIQLVTQNGTRSIHLNNEQPTQTLRVPLEPNVKLFASSDNKTYLNINLSSKPEIAPAGSRAKDGLSIARSYQKVMSDGSKTPMEQPQVGDLIQINLDVTFSDELSYVVIEDRLPSLFEIVNNDFESQKSRFKTSSNRSWEISHKELRSDRAVFFLNKPWGNAQQTISYLARVTTAGKAIVPAAKVEAMYNPEQLALSESKMMTTLQKDAVVSE